MHETMILQFKELNLCSYPLPDTNDSARVPQLPPAQRHKPLYSAQWPLHPLVPACAPEEPLGFKNHLRLSRWPRAHVWWADLWEQGWVLIFTLVLSSFVA